MTQAYHHTKFRWTENLTYRFIQLRKENGKLFTGRKYSAQAGWEYILQQMRQEFPTIMADVHYRVLKKKWSNLLQQYKELKNPVHGDRNKADDVSWPFYGAIDEVLESGRRTPSSYEYIDPHEFLCVSVAPEEAASPPHEAFPAATSEEAERKDTSSSSTIITPAEQRLRPSIEDTCALEIERVPRARQLTNRTSSARSQSRRKRNTKNTLISRLPGGTELSIEKVTPRSIYGKDLPKLGENDVVGATAENGNRKTNATTTATSMAPATTTTTTTKTTTTMNMATAMTTTRNESEERPRKSRRTRAPCHEEHEARLDRRLEQFFQYTRRRDEENRSIMMRILRAVETIANTL